MGVHEFPGVATGRGARAGVAIVYATILLLALIAVGSLAVDYGRVQLARTQLQDAVDAAARYGIIALPSSASDARTRARNAAGDNKVDGAPLSLTDADIEIGRWDEASRTFTALPDSDAGRNAMRITGRSRVPLMLMSLLGLGSSDVTARCTVLYQPPEDHDLAVPGTSNPYLAGMPDGTLDNTRLYNSSVRRDRAGPYTDPQGVYRAQGESPSQFNLTDLVPGEFVSFDAIAGTGAHGPTQTIVGPDGNLARIQAQYAGSRFGKSAITAPIDAVVGVFLEDSAPDGQTPPPALDYTTDASRDFSTFEPALRQVFFIGDGRDNNGQMQRFRVPAGATRLFIGKMDGTEWNNNVGVSTVTIHRQARLATVQ